jgi:hypothetical protein
VAEVTTPNAELAYRVLDRIDAEPYRWIQGDWATETDCGTAYCFAGWAVVLAGREPVWDYGECSYVADDRGVDEGTQFIGDAAREALGVEDTGSLFDGFNTREDLGRIVAEIFGPRPDAAA